MSHTHLTTGTRMLELLADRFNPAEFAVTLTQGAARPAVLSVTPRRDPTVHVDVTVGEAAGEPSYLTRHTPPVLLGSPRTPDAAVATVTRVLLGASPHAGQ